MEYSSKISTIQDFIELFMRANIIINENTKLSDIIPNFNQNDIKKYIEEQNVEIEEGDINFMETFFKNPNDLLEKVKEKQTKIVFDTDKVQNMIREYEENKEETIKIENNFIQKILDDKKTLNNSKSTKNTTPFNQINNPIRNKNTNPNNLQYSLSQPQNRSLEESIVYPQNTSSKQPQNTSSKQNTLLQIIEGNMRNSGAK